MCVSRTDGTEPRRLPWQIQMNDDIQSELASLIAKWQKTRESDEAMACKVHDSVSRVMYQARAILIGDFLKDLETLKGEGSGDK